MLALFASFLILVAGFVLFAISVFTILAMVIH